MRVPSAVCRRKNKKVHDVVDDVKKNVHDVVDNVVVVNNVGKRKVRPTDNRVPRSNDHRTDDTRKTETKKNVKTVFGHTTDARNCREVSAGRKL